MQDAETYKDPPSIHEQLLEELFRLRDYESVQTFYAVDGTPEQRVEHILDGGTYSIHYTCTADQADGPTIILQAENDDGVPQTMILEQDVQLSILNPNLPGLTREAVNYRSKLRLLERLKQLGRETQIATAGTLQTLADTITENCESQELVLEDTHSKQTQYRKPADTTPDAPSLFSLEKIEELEVDKQVVVSVTAYWTNSDSTEQYTLLSYTTTPGRFGSEHRSIAHTETSDSIQPDQINDLLMEQEVRQLLRWIDDSEVIDPTEINIKPQ